MLVVEVNIKFVSGLESSTERGINSEHLWCHSYTTGQQFFAECPRHSAKAYLHLAKALSSVALGKERSEKKLSAKASLLSSFCRALGKDFAECRKALGKM